MSEESDTETYQATYCENCGQLFDASETITATVEEPVHRVEILRAIGSVDEVVETTADEREQCECTGQVVQRWYIHPASNMPTPETEYDPDPERVRGRDPDEDALIDFGPMGGDWQEIAEIVWLEEGSPGDE